MGLTVAFWCMFGALAILICMAGYLVHEFHYMGANVYELLCWLKNKEYAEPESEPAKNDGEPRYHKLWLPENNEPEKPIEPVPYEPFPFNNDKPWTTTEPEKPGEPLLKPRRYQNVWPAWPDHGLGSWGIGPDTFELAVAEGRKIKERKIKERKECEVTVNELLHCARCSQDHKGLVFRKLFQPVGILTHWAPCPSTGDPILMRIENGAAAGTPEAPTLVEPAEPPKEYGETRDGAGGIL